MDESFTSADVDLMVFSEGANFREIADTLGLGRSGSMRPPYGIQVCPPQLFRTTPHYLLRARIEERHGLKLVIPHVRDVLIAKLHRSRTPEQEGLVPKDRRAFQRVRELCEGHPSEMEIIDDLVLCEPWLNARIRDRPNDFRLNVLDLFLTVFNRSLDIENEIVRRAQSTDFQLYQGEEEIDWLLRELNPERD